MSAYKSYAAAKGSCYLTHGGDNYDKKGIRKARRALDKLTVREGLETEEVQEEPKKTGPVAFRLVVNTQIYENYGAHSWDRKGTCPQHWKAKGGEEYHLHLGSADQVIVLGSKGLDELVKRIADTLTHNEYWEEYPIGFEVVPTDQETYLERAYREMHEEGYFNAEVLQSRLESLKF